MLNFLAAIAAAVLNDKIGNDQIAEWIGKAIKAVNAGRLVDNNLNALTAEIQSHVDGGTNPDDEDFANQQGRSDAAHDAIQNTDLGQGGASPNPAAGAAAGDGGSSGAADGGGENSNPGGDPPSPPG